MANELTIEINADDSGLQEGLGDIKQNLAIVGQSLMDLGSDIQGAFGDMISGMFETEKSLTKFQNQTGATAADMKKYGSEIKDLYKSGVGESIDDVATAMGVVQQQSKQLGIETPKDLKNISEMALILRDNFEVDLESSTKTAGNLMKNFGMTGKEVFDFIAKGFQEGLNQSGDWMDTLYEYSPQFAKMGLSANDMFNMIKSGSEAGIFTMDKMGDAIKEFGIRAIDGSENTKKAFTSIGLDAESTAQKLAKGGTDGQKAFFDIVQGIAKIKDPIKQNEMGVYLFGTMWEDLGGKAILGMGKVDKASIDYKGTMDKIKKNTATQDLGLQFKQLSRTIDIDVVQPIAEKLKPALEKISETAKKVLPGVKAMFAEIPSGIVVAVGAIAGLTAIIIPIIGIVGMLIPAFEAVSAAVAGFSISMITPFLPVIAIIAGVIIAFIFFKDEIISAFTAIYNFVMPIATAIWNFIKDKFIENVMPIVNTELPKLKAVFTQVWTGIQATIDTVLPLIISLIKGLAPIFTGIGTVLGVVWNIFTLIFGNILSLISTIFQSIMQIIGAAIKLIVGIINIGLGILSGDWSRVWNGIKQIAIGIWEALKAVFNVAIGIIKTYVLNGLAFIIGIFGGNMNDLLAKAKQIWEFVKQAFLDGITKAKNVVVSIGKTIANTLGDIGGSMYDAGVKIITQLIDGIKSMISKVKNTVSNITKTISDFFPHSPAKMGALKDFPNVGYTLMEQLMQGIDAGQSKLNNLTANVASDISGNINTTYGGLNTNQQSNLTIPIYLDGKKISEITSPYMVRALRQQGF